MCIRDSLIGDLLDLSPAQVQRLLRRGRQLFLARILAPAELDPPRDGPVEWLDPETGRRRVFDLDRAAGLAYERELERELETWSALAAAHRLAHGVWPATAPFEDAVGELLGP